MSSAAVSNKLKTAKGLYQGDKGPFSLHDWGAVALVREAYVVRNFAHDPILLSIEHISVTVSTLARIVAFEPTAGDE